MILRLNDVHVIIPRLQEGADIDMWPLRLCTHYVDDLYHNIMNHYAATGWSSFINIKSKLLLGIL